MPEIIDILEMEDSFLICMNYVEGKDLVRVIDTQGPVSQENAVKWCIQLCDVIHKFNGQVHRSLYCDIRPSTILLKPDGNIVVIGFDVVCSACDREFTGQDIADFPTLQQLSGGVPDIRTDIYFVGVLLCYLMTGQSPGLPAPKAKLLGELNDAYAGTAIEKIVWKCCQKNPEKRFKDDNALKSALKRLSRKKTPHAARQFAQRNKRRWASTFGCIILMIILIAILIYAEFSALGKMIGILLVCVCSALVEWHITKHCATQRQTKYVKSENPDSKAATVQVMRPDDATEKMAVYTGRLIVKRSEKSRPGALTPGLEQPKSETDYAQYQYANEGVGKTAPLFPYGNSTDSQFRVTEKILFVNTDIFV